MITRYAIFEGTLHDGQAAAFRDAIRAEVLPIWKQFPGASEVRVMFSEERDEGAPEYPLILAISYPDRAAMERALDSAPRAQSKDATARVLERFFTGRVHHHVTAAESHAV